MTATREEMQQYELGNAELYEIEVVDRERKEYGDVDGLAKTITSEGLIAPLAVMRLEEKPDSKIKYRLLAGGRRFFACIKAGQSPVPIRIYPPNLDPHQQKVIEHIENVYRKDFTVEEQLASAKAVHDAKVAVHGVKWEKTKDAPGWSQKMTADLLNLSEGRTSELLSMAAAAEKHPEIGKAKSLNDAKKIHNQIKKSAEKTAKAAQLSENAKTLDVKDEKLRLANSYHLGDCVENMRSLPSESFDIAELDPPYAVNFTDVKAKSDTAGSTTLEYNEISESDYIPFMTSVLTETYRCLKKDSWLILWHANQWEQKLFDICINLGFRGRMLPAIWSKDQTANLTMRPKEYLARSYEQFLYLSKGEPSIQKPGRNDIFSFKGVPSNNRSHPTERPIELIQEVLSTFIIPGGTVLCPFGGSGNTLLAANNIHSAGICFDLSSVYKDTFTIKVYEGTLNQYTSGKKS